MTTMKRHPALCAAILLALLPALLPAQEYPQRDSSIVFTPSSQKMIQKTTYEPYRSAWGLDLMLSNNGFGAGAFYRHEFSDVLAGFVQLAISDVKDDSEVDYIDPYTGTSYTPGKVNRLMLFPLTFGVQYRLFRETIADNFRPYVSTGLGPSLIMVAPYATPATLDLEGQGTYTYYNQIDFFDSLKKAQMKLAMGAYVGAGAYFGVNGGTLTGVSIRYYYIPYAPGIESLQNVKIKRFGGFYITLNFGSLI
jgi:hypothetical protein